MTIQTFFVKKGDTLRSVILSAAVVIFQTTLALSMTKDDSVMLFTSLPQCQNFQRFYNPFEKSIDDLENSPPQNLPPGLSCLFFHKFFVTDPSGKKLPNKNDKSLSILPYSVIIVIDSELPLKQALSETLNQEKTVILQKISPNQSTKNIAIVPESIIIGNGYNPEDINSLRNPKIWDVSAKSINLPRKTLKASYSYLSIALE